MPTYDYTCTACGHAWELFQSMLAKPVKACPACKRKTAKRLIGTGAAVLFKGGGFYETDYRSESYKKAAEADKKAAEPVKADDKKPAGETKSAPDAAAKPPAPTPTAPPKPAGEVRPKRPAKPTRKQ
ncbi:MAG: FmdB family zinc ribbon protein [Phycisphaerales bacterium]